MFNSQQADRESSAFTKWPELAAYVAPLAAYLPKALAPAKRNPRGISNEHRGLLDEIPKNYLAATIVRALLTELWGWRKRKSDEVIEAVDPKHGIKKQLQDVARAVGYQSIHAYNRVAGRSPFRENADFPALPLDAIATMGFYLIDAVSRAGLAPELFELHAPRGSGRRDDSPRLCISDAAAKRLGVFATVAGGRRPMVEMPRQWGRGQRGGYEYDLAGTVPLILGTDAKDPDCETIVYNTLNMLQATPWRVNHDVLRIAQEIDRQENLFVERSEKLQRDVILPERRLLEETAFEAGHNKPLHFVHALDFRGRVYPVATYLSPQGPDLARALLTFANGCSIAPGDTQAVEALDHYGEELSGTAFDLERIRRVADDPIGNRSFWWWAGGTGEKNRWQYLAYCIERAKLAEKHNASQPYESHLPVRLDASANGLQHMALLLKDEPLAKMVDVVVRPKGCEKVYDDVARRINDELRSRADDYRVKALLSRCDGGRITKEHAKSPTMIFGYGGTHRGIGKRFAKEHLRPQMRTEVEALAREIQPMLAGMTWGVRIRPWKPARYGTPRQATPKEIARVAQAAASVIVNELASCFVQAAWTALETGVTAPAYVLREWFQKTARAIACDDNVAEWRVPGTNFPARQMRCFTAKKGQKRQVWFYWCGVKQHHVTVLVKPPTKLSKRKHSTSLAPNVIHSLDAAHLMMTLEQFSAEDAPIGTIHDGFATWATRVTKLDYCFKLARQNLYSRQHNPFKELVQQFREKCEAAGSQLPTPPTQGTLELEDVYWPSDEELEYLASLGDVEPREPDDLEPPDDLPDHVRKAKSLH